jgi:5-hydroxyisourate hydrolase
MARLTTHVLDTMRGCPAVDMRVELWSVEGESRQHLVEIRTNREGRCDAPLLEGGGRGVWELQFHARDYFVRTGVTLPDPPFLDVITIRFGIADDDAHYHVPLLLSPWSYSTYRGS